MATVDLSPALDLAGPDRNRLIGIGTGLGSLIVVLAAVMTTPWVLLVEGVGMIAGARIAAGDLDGAGTPTRPIAEAWALRWAVASLGLLGGIAPVLWICVLASFPAAGLWAARRSARTVTAAERVAPGSQPIGQAPLAIAFPTSASRDDGSRPMSRRRTGLGAGERERVGSRGA